MKNRTRAGSGALGIGFIACIRIILFIGCLAASGCLRAMLVHGDATAAGYTFLVLATLAGMYFICKTTPAETLGGSPDLETHME